MKRAIQLIALTLTMSLVALPYVFPNLTAGKSIYRGMGGAVAAAAQQIPNVKVSATLPHVVNNSDHGRPAFDQFSWESFIALNWPAKIGSDGRPVRGVADTSKNVGDAGPRVWESWKADYELFQDEGVPPSDWSSYDIVHAPCGIKSDSQLNVKILPLVAKGASVLPGGVNQAMGGPLIDQHGKPVRYEIHLNQSYYDFVKNKQYYLQKNLPQFPSQPVDFPISTPNSYGVVEIKAAWREMSVAELNDPNISSRYYIVDAVVAVPASNPLDCFETKLGLVGLHIAHKSAPFNQWIWSTFEQEDNVPEYIYQQPQPNPTPPPPGGYSFYNIAQPPPPQTGANAGYLPRSAWKPFDPTKPFPKTPTQVARVNSIPVLTQQMNAQVRVMNKIRGTVWEHYKLIETQWPTVPNFTTIVNNPDTDEDKYPQGSGNPTPPSGADPPPPAPMPHDQVANVTMETYFQALNLRLKIFGSSCMHCHYQAAQTDFSWVLPDMAWDPNTGSRNPSPGVQTRTQHKIGRAPTLSPAAAETTPPPKTPRPRRHP
jgi:hypothetical protein